MPAHHRPIYAARHEHHAPAWRLIAAASALALLLAAGSIAFAAVGTLFAAMLMRTRSRDVLLPILLFPLLVPLVVVVVHLSAIVLEGQPLTAEPAWLQLLAAFDAVFLIGSYLVFEYVMES